MSYTFNTGNPVGPNGSADARDLVDNAQVADLLINSDELTAPDRLGVQRRTWAGINHSFAGYTPRGPWVTGTDYLVNELWEYGGSWYLVLSDYKSGATAEDDISGGNVALFQTKDFVRQVKSVAEAKALTALADGQAVYLSAGGRSGDFIYTLGDYTAEVAADTLSGVYIPLDSDPTVAAGCLVRRYEILIPQYFGIVEDGVTDNAANYADMRSAFPDATVYWPEITGLGYATSAPFAMSSSAANIGSKSYTKVIGLGNHALFEVNGGNCEVSYFTLETAGSRDSADTVGILLDGALSSGNFKTHVHHLRVNSEFNTFILSNVECDQSWFHDITSFRNHKRGVIDINTSGTASAPTGAATIERVWITPTGFDPTQVQPSLFGIRLGRSDSATIRNCIINGNQNDILVDNSGTTTERNWVLNISNSHFEHRYDGAVGTTPPVRWSASTSVVAGAIVRPTRQNANGYVYKAQNSGTTGASEPAWPANNVIGSEVSVMDNGITWVPWYSSSAIRFNGDSASTTEINSCQFDDHLVTILDAGNTISCKSIRSFGASIDKAYMRTNNNGVDSVLSISQSSIAGDFDLLRGSSITWVSSDSSNFESGASGIPTAMQRSSVLELSRSIKDPNPASITSLSGVSVDIASFYIPDNAEISAKISVSLRVFDAGFVCRGAASISIDVSALRVSSGSPVVTISDTVNDTLTDSDTFSLVTGSSYSSDTLTITCNGTHSRAGVTLRYKVVGISLYSGTKSVRLL